MANLEERRVLRITAAILGVDVDRKVDADDLRLEQRGNCELQGRAVLHEILHAVGVAGNSGEALNSAIAADLVSLAAVCCHRVLVIAGRAENVGHSAVLTAKFEEKLKLVEKGDCNVEDFVADYEAFIRSELDKITDVMAAW